MAQWYKFSKLWVSSRSAQQYLLCCKMFELGLRSILGKPYYLISTEIYTYIYLTVPIHPINRCAMQYNTNSKFLCLTAYKCHTSVSSYQSTYLGKSNTSFYQKSTPFTRCVVQLTDNVRNQQSTDI